MKRETLEAIQPIEFNVYGNGVFPLRMLRVERCYPATSLDDERLDVRTSDVGSDYRSVRLRSLRQSNELAEPDVCAWARAGWRVVPKTRDEQKAEATKARLKTAAQEHARLAKALKERLAREAARLEAVRKRRKLAGRKPRPVKVAFYPRPKPTKEFKPSHGMFLPTHHGLKIPKTAAGPKGKRPTFYVNRATGTVSGMPGRK